MAELMELLKSREVDFVLAFRPWKPEDGVESHILFQNYLAAIVAEGHPLAEKESVTLSELQRYDLALPSRGLQARNAFELIKPAGYDFRIKIELNEVNILLKIISCHGAVTDIQFYVGIHLAEHYESLGEYRAERIGNTDV